MKNNGIISAVTDGSLAAKTGLKPGDRIVSINGQHMQDLIDFSFAIADEEISMIVERKQKKIEHYFQKRFGEDIGIELESAVFDKIRQCANNCKFCFIDQMPKGLRRSLYVKDDDYRMSFLYGNFITLTNMSNKDWQRIHQFHLSPLFISVHTTNGELRQQMMHQPLSRLIKKQLDRLIHLDIDFHCQIVLCPNYNDGHELEKTLQDLIALQPNALSVAIVPLGMTKFRENCAPMQPVDRECALKTIAIVEKQQQICREKKGNSFAYLADEFYLIADKPIPSAAWYDDFPQLENGIGMMRRFEMEWHDLALTPNHYKQPLHLSIVVGTIIAEFIRRIINETPIHNLRVTVIPVENNFFGKTITVTGLLSAQDILNTLQKRSDHFDGMILPGVVLRKGESIFLDDMTLADFAAQLPHEVRVGDFAADLKKLLYQWK